MKPAWFLTVLMLMPLHAADVPSKTEKPNLLLILADDMGWGDLRCHGNAKLSTPSLDRLRTQSVGLEHFHVSPVCSPTRSSLLTGRHHARLHVINTSDGLEVMHGGEITLAEALKPAGYVSGCFGKWHNGSNHPSTARGQSFDEFFGFSGGLKDGEMNGKEVEMAFISNNVQWAAASVGHSIRRGGGSKYCCFAALPPSGQPPAGCLATLGSSRSSKP